MRAGPYYNLSIKDIACAVWGTQQIFKYILRSQH